MYCSHNVEKLKFLSYLAVRRMKSPNGWLRYIDRLERRAVMGADLIIAVSDADRDAFVNIYGIEKAKIAVVENGSDTERCVPVPFKEKAFYRNALGLPEQPIVVYVAGSTARPKLLDLNGSRNSQQQCPSSCSLSLGPFRPNLRADPGV